VKSELGELRFVPGRRDGDRDAPFERAAAGEICVGAAERGGVNPFCGFIEATNDEHQEHQRYEKADVAEGENHERGDDLGCEAEAEDESHGPLLATFDPALRERFSGWMRLGAGGTAAQKVEQQHDQADDENDVNQAAGDVKREKPKQPKNDQNCGDYPKHFFFSLLPGARGSAGWFVRNLWMTLAAWKNYARWLE